MSKPRIVPGDQIKIRSGLEPHAKNGGVYTVAKVSGGSPGYPSRIYLAERDCGLAVCAYCNNGWEWDEYTLEKIRPDIKAGDTLICNSSDLTHFTKGGKYVVKAVLQKRDDNNKQKFVVEACQRVLNGSMCSCSDGVRTWTFSNDFDLFESFQPITLEDMKAAKRLPSVDDVAGFFGLDR